MPPPPTSASGSPTQSSPGILLLTLGSVLGLAFLSGSVTARAQAPETPPANLKILFVGDILLEAPWLVPAPAPASLFSRVRSRLAEADLVIGNLEQPLTNHPTETPYKNREAVAAGRDFIFRATSEEAARAMRDAGIDVATLANNHTMDYTEQGLLDTLARLRAAGILAVGGGENLRAAEQLRVVALQGVRFGILSLSDVVPKYSWATSDSPGIASAKYAGRVRQVIRRARPRADILAVVFHWGTMFSPTPSERQIELVEVSRRAGADLILGAHPHVLQGVGCFDGAPVVYSAGNFVFPTGNTNARRSALFEIQLAGPKIQSIRVVPVQLDAQGRPHLAAGRQAQGILEGVAAMSTELGSRFRHDTATCPP